MPVWARALTELEWGPPFWRFAAMYCTMPWFAWKTAMSMRWYRGEHMNMGFRIANLTANYALAILAGTALLLLMRSLTQGDWLSLLALALGGLSTLLVLLIRLQTSFRLSAQM